MILLTERPHPGLSAKRDSLQHLFGIPSQLDMTE